MNGQGVGVSIPTQQDILAKFQQVRRSGESWTARCPAHDDRNPSLSISDGGDKWLLKCHAGCTTEAVCAAAGLEMRDLFKGATSSAAPRIAAVYDYPDENGKLLFQIVRYEPGFNGDKKTFRQRQPDGKGGWTWNVQGVPRVLYRLPEVVAATDVLICEGEKDCETAHLWGLTATCNPMGADKWREEYSEPLRGKRVTIIADADEVGRKHAQQVAKSLTGKATSVKVIELPDAKDLHEWASRGGSRDTLLELTQKTAEWKEQPVLWRQAFKSHSEMEKGDVCFLINRILPEGVTFIGALAGAGKTWVALSMAKAFATGQPFLGVFAVPEPVNVLYLIPEAGEKAFRKRMERMRIPEERFLCRTMKQGTMKLDDPILLAAVGELKPVVFLDSAIRFNEAENENDAAQNATGLANNLFALIKAGAPSIVGLHHSPKSSAGQEMTLENMLRGSGDIGAMCDTAWGLQCLNPDTFDLRVKNLKPRDFEEPPPTFLLRGRPYINETGDFTVLIDQDPANVEVLKMDNAIRANPKATYRDLHNITGIAQGRIKDVAAKAGWIRIDDQWIQSKQSSFVM